MGRVYWDDCATRKLLIILNEEKDKGVSRFNWGSIADNFNLQAGTDLNAKQVQNHYTDMKERYKAWLEFQSLTGIAYNLRTKEVDVDESATEAYQAFLERNRKYGLTIVKRNLANTDELNKLFDGRAAYPVGGCFSPEPLYLASPMEGAIELYEGNENGGVNGVGDTLSGDDSKSSPSPSPCSVSRKLAVKSSRKRKREDTNTVNSPELKQQTSFDNVIQLLMNAADIGSSNKPSRAKLISDELARLKVAEKKGNPYHVSAMEYLCQEKNGDIFLALQNDEQKWIFLKGVKVDPLYL